MSILPKSKRKASTFKAVLLHHLLSMHMEMIPIPHAHTPVGIYSFCSCPEQAPYSSKEDSPASPLQKVRMQIYETQMFL